MRHAAIHNDGRLDAALDGVDGGGKLWDHAACRCSVLRQLLRLLGRELRQQLLLRSTGDLPGHLEEGATSRLWEIRRLPTNFDLRDKLIAQGVTEARKRLKVEQYPF